MAIGLVLLGALLSAFFSGSETGFYRVTRVRLVMDAKSGKWISRALLWLVRRPTLVVATVLIGNNIANYTVSLGLVLGSESWFRDWETLRAILPLLATPMLFIYGELLPKYLYFNAPYFLSTKGAPLMLIFTALFLPISAIVILLETISQRFAGGEHSRSRYSLEREELQRTMVEGQETGLLRPVQQQIGQNLFTFGVKPIRQFALPVRSIPLVDRSADYEQVLEAAAKARQKFVGIWDEEAKELVGCYRLSDVALQQSKQGQPDLEQTMVVKTSANNSTIQVLTQLQNQHSPVAQVVDPRGVVLGIVSRERLVSLLLPS